jgi:6-phosphogluconolactonase
MTFQLSSWMMSRREEIVRQLSRRGFIYGSAALSIAGRSWPAAARPFALGTSRLLLVGTQTTATSKGIYAYSFEFATGELKLIGLAAEAKNPTFLALSPSGNLLFAANELDPFEGKHKGAVTSYAVDKANAKLTKINEVSALGDGTCHVSVDDTGRCAFAANYGSGSAVSFSVGDDGHLSPAVSFEQYTGHGPNRERQEAPHAHRVTVSPDNHFLFVNDLGLDLIHIYRLDAATAKLTPNDPPAWKSAPGAGPRALRFHPNGKWAYCVTEMTSSVDVLRWDKSRGTLETIQEISLVSPSYHGVPTAGCEIVFDHHGRFAYAADRFDDVIVTFAVSPKTGKLTLLNRIACGGKVPRHIALDPSGRWLLVANQGSDTISVLARDPRSGQLTKSSRSIPLSLPECLIFT